MSKFSVGDIVQPSSEGSTYLLGIESNALLRVTDVQTCMVSVEKLDGTPITEGSTTNRNYYDWRFDHVEPVVAALLQASQKAKV